MEAKIYFEREFGKDSPEYLSATAILITIFLDLGRLQETEELVMKEIEISKRLHGPDHLSTVMRMRSLAMTYFLQGRLKEAEDRQLQVEQNFKHKFGIDHPWTLEFPRYFAINIPSPGSAGRGRKIEA